MKIIRSLYRTVVPKRLRQIIYTYWQRSTPPELSMIMATYNVGLYLDEFMQSILKQDSHLDDLELIFVDDGSTDDTPELLRKWQAKHPRLIRVIRQDNAGASMARNTGLKAARGTWVSFPDPDDFVSKNYLRVMRTELKKTLKYPLLAISTKLVVYLEDKNEYHNSHPLNYRFRSPTRRFRSNDLKNFIQMNVATVWIRRSVTVEHGLQFEGHGWGSFEDTHFINRVLLSAPDHTITFMAEPVYYYRKRSDGSSQLDGAVNKKSNYLKVTREGCLDLIKNAARSSPDGTAPAFIQRTILYHLVWIIRYLVDNPHHIDTVLTPQERDTFEALLHEVFVYISPDAIAGFSLAGCTEEHKVALLAVFKGVPRDMTSIYLSNYDPVTKSVRLHWFSGADQDIKPVMSIDNVVMDYEILGGRCSYLFNKPYVKSYCFDTSVAYDRRLSCAVEDEASIFKRGGTAIGYNLSGCDIDVVFYIPRPTSTQLDAKPENRDLRDFAVSATSRKTYAGAWLLMDTLTRADDNAEHLYRHLMKQPNVANKIWFILDRSSKDWDRLEADGFRLLDYRSPEHIAAMANAEILASSHADIYVRWPVDRTIFADLFTSNFIFLQHGVIHNDLSKWLNPKQLKCIITSGQAEYDAMVSGDGSYACTSQDVALTGLARHDSLLSKAATAQADILLIMPTWRQFLLGKDADSAIRWSKIDSFTHSEYFQNWSAVLQNPHLVEQARSRNLRVVFAPHQNMTPYLDDFVLPVGIEMFNVAQDGSYQDLLSQTALLLTDYSSVAFDVAYLEQKVAYFQFDREQIFSGNHTFRRGYFDYESDGFGPVATMPDAAVENVMTMLNGAENPIYAQRRHDFFAFRDGQCCARIEDIMTRISNRKNLV